MYKSGQIVFDEGIDEPVIFIEGDGDKCNVVCTGVKNTTAVSYISSILPIWKNNDKILVGKLAAYNFATILDVNKENYRGYTSYINKINKEISTDGKRNGYKYHIKG